MSGLAAYSARLQIPTHVVVPTYWCATCQLSLRTPDEKSAHVKMFPLHAVRAVARLVCPSCGNYVPLENGFFPEHWVGGSYDTRRCRGSGKRA